MKEKAFLIFSNKICVREMAEDSKSLLIFPELPAPSDSKELVIWEEAKSPQTMVERIGVAFAELGFKVVRCSKERLVIAPSKKKEQIAIFLSKQSGKERA